MADRGWQFWIDRGGTFTDIVARAPGRPPADPQAAVGEPRPLRRRRGGGHPRAARPRRRRADPGRPRSTRSAWAPRSPPTRCSSARASAPRWSSPGASATRCASATRTARGSSTATSCCPSCSTSGSIEVDERVARRRHGAAPARPRRARRPNCSGPTTTASGAVAVVCMHGHLHPAHEQAIGELAERDRLRPDLAVQRGQPADEAGARAATRPSSTPTSRRSCAATSSRSPTSCRDVRLMFMQSNGGLAEAGHFRGKDAILSGPAGGIVGMARMSQLAGFDRVIGFDMGGTSTDVSHFAGEYERVFNTQVAGVRLRAPMLDIHTVAAGGGSILHFDGSRYRVGPDSAGADPGPACYRARRPADGHRRQRHARPHPARALPAGVRPGRRPAARRRGRARGGSPSSPREIARADRRRPHARAGRRGLPADRGGEHGQRGQADLGAEGPRRHAVRADHVRRRRRPARLRGRRLAGHPHRARPADGRRAVRPRHRPGRHRRRCASSPSRRRSTPTPMARLARGRRRAGAGRPRRTARRGRARRARSGSPRRAHLRYDGTDTALAGRARRAGRDGGRVRGQPTARRTPSCWTGRSSSRRSRSRRPGSPSSRDLTGRRRRRRRRRPTPRPRPCALWSGGGVARRRRSIERERLPAGDAGDRARRSSPRPTPPPSSTTAGGRR